MDQQPTLETDNLLLRPLTSDDADAILHLFADERVTKFLGFDPLTASDQAADIIREAIERFGSRQGFSWGIVLGQSGDLIGTCGFKRWVTDRASRAEVSCALAPAHWGTGVATEALTEIIRFGFAVMNVNRIEAVTYRGANRPARLLEKLGFQFEGVMRERGYLRDEPIDDMLFSLLRRDWETKP